MRILLIGNYGPDRQESMLRYARVLAEGLAATAHEVRLVAPRPVLDFRGRGAVGAWKWLGYVDKLVLAPRELRRAARWADVVHVCDHSNATYVPRSSAAPWVVTCHDLLALRGALGEDTDCPASLTGRVLQRWILAGLRRADALVSDSEATRRDVERLAAGPRTVSVVVPPPLNHPFRVLEPTAAEARLATVPLLRDAPYLLMVGSGLRRKNRECAVRILGRLRGQWHGRLVFAGEPLSPALRAAAGALGVADRIVDVPGPSGDLLEALYNRAFALLFPSRYEGFGWPVVEAQACGCPVIASDAPPVPEVSGGGAVICRLGAETDFDAAVLALAVDPARRAALVDAGFANAARFDVPTFTRRMLDLYAGFA